MGLELDTPLTLLFSKSFSLFTQGKQRMFLHLHRYIRIFIKEFYILKTKLYLNMIYLNTDFIKHKKNWNGTYMVNCVPQLHL